MQVSQKMTKNPVTVGPDDSLEVAAAKMKAGNFRRLPVEDDGKLIGIVSQYDLQAHRETLGSTPVRAAMTGPPIVVSFTATLEHAASLLATHKIGALPVVHAGKLIGIITASDLLVSEPRPLPEWAPGAKVSLGPTTKQSMEFVIEFDCKREGDRPWTAECITVPGITSDGATQQEALRRTASAALRAIAEFVAAGDSHWAKFTRIHN